MAVVGDEIERLSRQRQGIWHSCEPYRGAEVERLSSRLADLYEAKRYEQAHTRIGVRRADIVRQARVESELERLMSEKTR